MQIDEQAFMIHYFLAPASAIHFHQLIKCRALKLQATPVDVLVSWNPSNHSFTPMRVPLHPFYDPSQYAHIFAESRPQELPILILAKPIHMKDPWCCIEPSLHLEPVPKIIAHVVSAEGKHRHRIAAHASPRARRCRRSL